METLKLPIIKSAPTGKKHLSMDQYLEFVKFNLKNTVDLDAVWKIKKKQAVNVPFVLR